MNAIVDAHLDLAYNALRGRHVLRPALEQTPEPDDIPTVGVPDLHAGGVKLICATIFAEPSLNGKPGYRDATEAHAAGWAQLQWYLDREKDGIFSIVRSRADLHKSLEGFNGASWSGAHTLTDQSHLPPLPAIILLEGADPIRSPDDVPMWFNAGVRIVGLSWKQTRYAGGTGAPGPLSHDGVAIIKALDAVGMIHDTSHLAEESFWQLLHLTRGPIIASHSNCRSIVPTDRQLSDEMIRAIIARGGVIGINFFDRFLLPPNEKRRATLDDVIAHIQHICDLAGNCNHVAIGTDMDGGLGRDQIPQEIVTSADLPKLADALQHWGFDSNAVANIMSDNWRRFFAGNLALT